MYIIYNMVTKDDTITSNIALDESEEKVFREHMSEQFKLFMDMHFGDPACEECLQSYPE